MTLAVCDYVYQPFEDVCGRLEPDLPIVLQAASDRLDERRALRVQAGPPLVLGRAIASVHVAWTGVDGCWFEGELRIIPVTQGAGAITELLLSGETSRTADRDEVARWAHAVLAQLADPSPVPRRRRAVDRRLAGDHLERSA